METNKLSSRIPITPEIQAKLDAAAESGEEVDVAELLKDLVPESPPMPENWSPDPLNFNYLLGINKMRNVFMGTPHDKAVSKRRAKNKQAKQTRKTNRRR